MVGLSRKALTTIRRSIVESRFDVIRIGCQLRSYLFVDIIVLYLTLIIIVNFSSQITLMTKNILVIASGKVA